MKMQREVLNYLKWKCMAVLFKKLNAVLLVVAWLSAHKANM